MVRLPQIPSLISLLSFIPWDSLFTDPYLRALIDTALVHNLDLRVAHEHVQQAETVLQRAARATKLKMQYGSTTYLEVLTAQNSLLQAQFTQIANRMQTLQAVVTLYRALGGGSEYEEL